jgi:hypothetical protein
VQRVLSGVNGRQDLGAWLWGAADILRGAVEKGFIYNTVGEADGFLAYGAEQALKKAKGQ